MCVVVLVVGALSGWIVEASLQLPVVQDLNSSRLESDFVALLSFPAHGAILAGRRGNSADKPWNPPHFTGGARELAPSPPISTESAIAGRRARA